MATTTDLDLSADTIDVRDIIERFKELEDIETPDEDEAAELAQLTAILEDLKGYGGDEQFRGDWYPVTLIADSYFTTYAQELAEDIGAIDRNAQWPLQYIDWQAAAHALQQDYSTVEIEGSTYHYR